MPCPMALGGQPGGYQVPRGFVRKCTGTLQPRGARTALGAVRGRLRVAKAFVRVRRSRKRQEGTPRTGGFSVN